VELDEEDTTLVELDTDFEAIFVEDDEIATALEDMMMLIGGYSGLWGATTTHTL